MDPKLRKLILIRGPSGIGKSYYANYHCEKKIGEGQKAIVAEADQFFLDKFSQYDFQPALLPQAHLWCQEKVRQAMLDKTDIIFVANTFSQLWELKPYVELALNYRYQIWIENMFDNLTLNPEQLAQRSIHKVPAKVIDKTIKRTQGKGSGWLNKELISIILNSSKTF